MQPTPPVCQGMVLAQDVWRDALTGRGGPSLLGLFSMVASPTYPYTLPSLVAYFVLTGGRGRLPINVRIIEPNGEREEVLATHSLEIALDDPLAINESWVKFRNVHFPHPGTYLVQVRSNGEMLFERRLLLGEVRKPVA